MIISLFRNTSALPTIQTASTIKAWLGRLPYSRTASAVYASTKQRVFPGTSVFDAANPARSFFGSELKDAHALRYGMRLGAQYRLSDALALGAVFANRVALPLRGGRLDVNFSALGLGRPGQTRESTAGEESTQAAG
jgi:hypothetical protein